jgi:hypothetical protein
VADDELHQDQHGGPAAVDHAADQPGQLQEVGGLALLERLRLRLDHQRLPACWGTAIFTVSCVGMALRYSSASSTGWQPTPRARASEVIEATESL